MRQLALPSRTLGLALAAALPLLTACEDEVTAPDDDYVEGSISIDASSQTEFVYLSLDGDGSVLTVADPASSTEWDLAIRRYSAKLNGGVAGPGSVRGANLANNAGATAEQVLAFTPADGEAAFEAVTEADIAGATFRADGLIEDNGGPWFRFDGQAGTLVANPGAAWKIATADGGHGLFRVIELNMAGQAPLGATVEVRYQAPGGALGAASEVEIDFSQGPGFVDISAGALGAPGGCDWDFSVAPSFSIDINTDCSAGTFPLDATEDFTQLAAADDAPEYGPFLSTISGALPATISDASGLFWYGLEGNNRMWPTYNVFLVEVDGAVYKLQVTDYYSATGESGHPTLRFQRLR
ncbi:HmuY family protein [Gaopeijia maritima]|uniref:HmuY family protein n=1 Tax=Gaopeijia maritima TaxID=3119007 RepID=A0ABU9EDL8_9BACT